MPAYQRAGRSIHNIRAEVADPASRTNSPVRGGFAPVHEEAAAFERDSLSLIRGPDSKDVPGNDVLLLDQRLGALNDFLGTTGIANTLVRLRSKHIRLINLVRPKGCIQVYPCRHIAGIGADRRGWNVKSPV